MSLALAAGLGAGAFSLLSSFGSSYLTGQSAYAGYNQSVYAAGLQMYAGEQDADKYARLAENYYLDANRAKKKKILSVAEQQRVNKIIAGRNRGKQQGLESGGTTRTMTVEQQEGIMKDVEDALKWDWDQTIERLEASGLEAIEMANIAYINGVNQANATMYSGASSAAAQINSANMTMALALPNAVLNGVSAYTQLGGTFGSTSTGLAGSLANDPKWQALMQIYGVK